LGGFRAVRLRRLAPSVLGGDRELAQVRVLRVARLQEHRDHGRRPRPRLQVRAVREARGHVPPQRQPARGQAGSLLGATPVTRRSAGDVSVVPWSSQDLRRDEGLVCLTGRGADARADVRGSPTELAWRQTRTPSSRTTTCATASRTTAPAPTDEGWSNGMTAGLEPVRSRFESSSLSFHPTLTAGGTVLSRVVWVRIPGVERVSRDNGVPPGCNPDVDDMAGSIPAAPTRDAPGVTPAARRGHCGSALAAASPSGRARREGNGSLTETGKPGELKPRRFRVRIPGFPRHAEYYGGSSGLQSRHLAGFDSSTRCGCVIANWQSDQP